MAFAEPSLAASSGIFHIVADSKFMADEHCPFCSIPRVRVLLENDSGYLMSDGFPISPGHSFVILRDHYANFFGISEPLRTDLSLTYEPLLEENCLLSAYKNRLYPCRPLRAS